MPGVVSNPSPLPSACTIHSDAEYEVMVGRKTSRSGSNDRGVIFRRKASSSILTIRHRTKSPTDLDMHRHGLRHALHPWQSAALSVIPMIPSHRPVFLILV